MQKSLMTNYSEDEFKTLLKQTLREIMAETKPAIQAISEILDVKQAAEFLRLKVTTIYEKTSRKLIPHFKKGNKLLFKRSELEAWVSEGKVKPSSETETEAATYVLNKKQK